MSNDGSSASEGSTFNDMAAWIADSLQWPGQHLSNTEYFWHFVLSRLRLALYSKEADNPLECLSGGLQSTQVCALGIHWDPSSLSGAKFTTEHLFRALKKETPSLRQICSLL